MFSEVSKVQSGRYMPKEASGSALSGKIPSQEMSVSVPSCSTSIPANKREGSTQIACALSKDDCWSSHQKFNNILSATVSPSSIKKSLLLSVNAFCQSISPSFVMESYHMISILSDL